MKIKHFNFIVLIISVFSIKAQQLRQPFEFPILLSGNFGELRNNHFHSGIDFKTQGVEGKAVHAVPGESQNIHDKDFLKCEPIEDFYQQNRACSGAFARVDCTDSIAWQALSFALDKVKRKFSFDHSYLLDDSNQYYCTELIYRAYLQAGINLADERRHEMPMPGTDGRFIFPSDILASPLIRKVRKLAVCQMGTTQ